MTREIFIILSSTGTLLSETIKLYTKATYNHTSIAFDRELKELYSFGRKRPHNPLIAGFVKEDVNQCILKNADCCIYKLEVEDECYEAMKQVIHSFEMEMDKYRYNLIGLFGVMLNIPINREYHYFCSQFVATVLNNSGKFHFEKDPALVRPDDFHRINDAELVYEGCLSNYSMSLCV